MNFHHTALDAEDLALNRMLCPLFQQQHTTHDTKQVARIFQGEITVDHCSVRNIKRIFLCTGVNIEWLHFSTRRGHSLMSIVASRSLLVSVCHTNSYICLENNQDRKCKL